MFRLTCCVGLYKLQLDGFMNYFPGWIMLGLGCAYLWLYLIGWVGFCDLTLGVGVFVEFDIWYRCLDFMVGLDFRMILVFVYECLGLVGFVGFDAFGYFVLVSL